MTFILKWNPEISSVKLSDWEYWIQHFPFIRPNWSVFDYENYDNWDTFFMVKVGSGKTGVVAKGVFCSKPYEGGDWSGQGRQVFYRDLSFQYIMHPDKDPIIPTEELEKAIPEYDWRGGHSGEYLNDWNLEAMEKLWKKYAKKNTDFLQKQDDFGQYVIEPSALMRVKRGWLWEEKICSYIKTNADMYTECATHDCVNLKFSHDYSTRKFRLNVLFDDIALKILCNGLTKIQMDLDNQSTFWSDFSISEAGPEHLYLRSNGIEIWCTGIEFLGTEEYEKNSYPVSI